MNDDLIMVVVPMAVTVSVDVVQTMQRMMTELKLSREELVTRIFSAGLASLEIEAGAVRK